MDGLLRRAHNVHKHDHLVLPEDECDAALGPLRNIMAHIEDAISAGAGTVDQIAERFAGILEPGLTDYIVLQIPTGDMTLDETKRTMDLFINRGQAAAGEAIRLAARRADSLLPLAVACRDAGHAVGVLPTARGDHGGGSGGVAVRALLDEPGYRQAAGAIGDEIAAMPAPAATVPVLERLAAS